MPEHTAGVASFTVVFDRPLDWTAFGVWASMLLHRHGADVLRLKGLLNVAGVATPVLINGVQHIVHPPSHLEQWPDSDRRSRSDLHRPRACSAHASSARLPCLTTWLMRQRRCWLETGCATTEVAFDGRNLVSALAAVRFAVASRCATRAPRSAAKRKSPPGSPKGICESSFSPKPASKIGPRLTKYSLNISMACSVRAGAKDHRHQDRRLQRVEHQRVDVQIRDVAENLVAERLPMGEPIKRRSRPAMRTRR